MSNDITRLPQNDDHAAKPNSAPQVAGRTIDPALEEAYWREQFHHRPYATPVDAEFEKFAPAYQFAWAAYQRYGRDAQGNAVAFGAAENELRSYWEEHMHDPKLSWEEANEPIRDAWERVEHELREHPASANE